MIRKVKVYPDPEIGVATARVNIEVTLNDGRVLRVAYFPAKGAADNSLTRDELAGKFNECAEWGGVSVANAARAVELFLGLERVQTVEALMKCVIADARHR
jgi:hypothetical protein